MWSEFWITHIKAGKFYIELHLHRRRSIIFLFQTPRTQKIIASSELRRRPYRVNFRKDFWDCYRVRVKQIEVIWEEDAPIAGVLGRGMSKTRGCPYHCNSELNLDETTHYCLKTLTSKLITNSPSDTTGTLTVERAIWRERIRAVGRSLGPIDHFCNKNKQKNNQAGLQTYFHTKTKLSLPV